VFYRDLTEGLNPLHSVLHPLRIDKCDQASQDETHLRRATDSNARLLVTRSEPDLPEVQVAGSTNPGSRKAHLGI
jgi:hypothetical protein